jgi:hypothetical protein
MFFCFFHVSCQKSKIEIDRSRKKFNFQNGVAKFNVKTVLVFSRRRVYLQPASVSVQIRTFLTNKLRRASAEFRTWYFETSTEEIRSTYRFSIQINMVMQIPSPTNNTSLNLKFREVFLKSYERDKNYSFQ